jgi:hypothetical protein
MQGIVRGIFIAESAGQPMISLDSCFAEQELGLVGDRYFGKGGTFSKNERVFRDISLIEIEAVQALARDYKIHVEPKDLRRNILTEGFALNHFVGKRFLLSDVLLLGVELCEPCGYLSKMLNHRLKDGLKHRGGLRARILASGELRLQQTIRAQPY